MKPWGDVEKAEWKEQQTIKRSYKEEVLGQIESLKTEFSVEQYGSLSYDPQRYPLFIITNKNLDQNKPFVLITGGVHGYETSGVQGALRFLSTTAKQYEDDFNFVVVPCVSPWGYETINRWNPLTVDPNRSFQENGPSEECNQAMKAIWSKSKDYIMHIDLHETTDTDNTVFRPALAARDAIHQDVWDIPDGFYLVADADTRQLDFQKAVIDSVEKVTHIAPSDKDDKIIGCEVLSHGVIEYPAKKIFLCMGLTDAKYRTTTEVYPDSPKATDEECTLAQVAAVVGGLDFIKSVES